MSVLCIEVLLCWVYKYSHIKKSSEAQLDFIMPIKSTTTIEEGKKGKKEKKSKRIYRASQNIRRIYVFLESLLSESFPLLGVIVHLTSLGCPPTLCYLRTCCGGSSNSNLVLLLCVLASNVRSYQNWCVFFCGSAKWPFICSTDTEAA